MAAAPSLLNNPSVSFVEKWETTMAVVLVDGERLHCVRVNYRCTYLFIYS